MKNSLMRLFSVFLIILAIPPLACSRLEKAADEARNKSAERMIQSAIEKEAGRADASAERGLAIGEESSSASDKELRKMGFVPPSAQIKGYVEGIDEDTVNMVTETEPEELVEFYDSGFSGRGYANVYTMKTDNAFSGEWKKGKELIAVYAFRQDEKTNISVVFTKKP